ncbi:hypothetical protein BS47DRAFT_459987 [Hydnum rufescens UP504]|uniref:Uncharacterized protein n=1 Tax=Hydnum rufescens UP504 TaxID=1448309 RepID=A0A9P6AI41_9AGAM|nr:hypothetical protein BS47DRAFT_459987 [Hydnum rufescens UP504]
MELRIFRISESLWLNQNAGAHVTYGWPWLLPSEKIVGHELEHIPDTSSMAWIFINPCPIAPWASRGHPPRAVNPSVQSRELQVYANAPVLRAEWANLERSGVSGDWVGGVRENGIGEGLDSMHKALEKVKQH